jgi:hypothetical protein
VLAMNRKLKIYLFDLFTAWSITQWPGIKSRLAFGTFPPVRHNGMSRGPDSRY